MVVHTSSEQTNISSRDAGSALLADAANISTGVTAAASASESTTLFLSVDGAVEVTVEVSPNGGETWFTLPESPVKFGGTGDDAIQFRYDFDRLRLTSNDADVAVTAALREVV